MLPTYAIDDNKGRLLLSRPAQATLIVKLVSLAVCELQ